MVPSCILSTSSRLLPVPKATQEMASSATWVSMPVCCSIRRSMPQMTGLPRAFTVSSSEMIEAFEEPSTRILEAIHGVLERTPPELVADISTNGIVMTGGGSLIWGFDKLVESHTGIETHVADDAISCVAYGTGKSLDDLDHMQDGTMNLSRRKQMNY